VSDGGIIRCVNADTGADIWFERLPGEYSASPLAVGESIYFFGQNGTTTVFRNSDEYTELASNVLDGELMASPAVAGKALFVRSTKNLYRIEQKDQP
jgi:outer membrane protein assembly factor BamB